ncbi:GNAT family N-acetyltransferase [Streptomyces sp. TRM43335]|uniref:GNAT family N-acetyltransferase n=2 Tax=Streptomyces taklimakanensis TaxID=2569853 RepID=A0A6G2BCT2_9ACTN|nr:GNAT family N-acetyltransferase [Streptomyces taklimakanensis]
MPVTRVVSVDDVEALTDRVRENRAFLAPWEPVRDEAYFTVEGQRAVLEAQLDAYARGSMVPLVIVDEDDRPIGRVNLNNVVRGAFQSADLGYWVSESHTGRGIASAAVAEAVEVAFGRLGLHRLQAGTLLHNTASQRVLARNGFRPFAVAPSYLRIAGQWQDHVLYHLLAPS